MAKNRMTVKMKNRQLKRQGFFLRYLEIEVPRNYNQYIQNKLVKVISLEKFDQALIDRDDGNEADSVLWEVVKNLKRQDLLPNANLSNPNPRYMGVTYPIERVNGGTGDKWS